MKRSTTSEWVTALLFDGLTGPPWRQVALPSILLGAASPSDAREAGEREPERQADIQEALSGEGERHALKDEKTLACLLGPPGEPHGSRDHGRDLQEETVLVAFGELAKSGKRERLAREMRPGARRSESDGPGPDNDGQRLAYPFQRGRYCLHELVRGRVTHD